MQAERVEILPITNELAQPSQSEAILQRPFVSGNPHMICHAHGIAIHHRFGRLDFKLSSAVDDIGMSDVQQGRVNCLRNARLPQNP